MQVKIGQTNTTLQSKNFIASGGEGSIYAWQNKAIKIYTDKSKAIPLGKINELAILKKSEIIGPQEAVRNTKNEVIGYSMDLIKNTESLCRLFAPTFKKNNRITTSQVLHLVLELRKNIDYIHKNNILIVDVNEMNFLISNDFNKVYSIDVDSYQTSHYPAQVIMEHIRDWQAGTNWSTGSDWFSFGIISFQMFSGIHPYKGKHPTIKDTTDRMKQNISVFDKNVKIPPAFKFNDKLPGIFKDWYKTIFVENKRICPPDSATATIDINVISNIVSTDKLIIEELVSIPNVIKRINLEGNNFTITDIKSKKYSHQGKYICDTLDKDIKEPHFISTDGTLYKKHQNIITRTHKIGNNFIDQKASDIMEYSTTIYDNVVIQRMLNNDIATIFPTNTTKYDINLTKRVEGKIIDAKYESNLLVIITEQNGKYHRNMFVLDFYSQNLIKQELVLDIDYTGIVFTVLDSNICAYLNEEGDLELFSLRNICQRKTIKDPVLSSDMLFFNGHDKLLMAQNNKLYSIKTK